MNTSRQIEKKESEKRERQKEKREIKKQKRKKTLREIALDEKDDRNILKNATFIAVQSLRKMNLMAWSEKMNKIGRCG